MPIAETTLDRKIKSDSQLTALARFVARELYYPDDGYDADWYAVQPDWQVGLTWLEDRNFVQVRYEEGREWVRLLAEGLDWLKGRRTTRRCSW